jgi:hypothetical protein
MPLSSTPSAPASTLDDVRADVVPSTLELIVQQANLVPDLAVFDGHHLLELLSDLLKTHVWVDQNRVTARYFLTGCGSMDEDMCLLRSILPSVRFSRVRLEMES